MFRLNVVRPKLDLYFYLFMNNSLRRTMLAIFLFFFYFSQHWIQSFVLRKHMLYI